MHCIADNTNARFTANTVDRIATGCIARIDANVRVVEKNAALRGDCYLKWSLPQEHYASQLNTCGCPPVDPMNTVHVIVSFWEKAMATLLVLHKKRTIGN